ncbi:hypothetical protein ACWDOR_43455 [Streptosporangium canum]
MLIVVGSKEDRHHHACLELLRRTKGPILVPSPVLGEVGCCLTARVGPEAEPNFLRSFGGNGFRLAELGGGDLVRVGETHAVILRAGQSAGESRFPTAMLRTGSETEFALLRADLPQADRVDADPDRPT